MKSIEQYITPLIDNMFPAFYKEEGQDFMAFVNAYYEWLELNHQILILEDSTGFNPGDIVYQGETSGVVLLNEDLGDNTILVRLDSFDTYRCFAVNTELESITSSSGAETSIVHGGLAKRMSPIYWARHLAELRDIDSTVDLFILRFKEKYLKNIEFDTFTNKELLVKNSLDLYRSKGTERSIDLFFRLVYGVSASVYYPGDDLFRLSSAEWYKPRYLEITSSDRTIDLVGKQITGVTSGATAFVEKYIKRRIKGGFVYVLYISNVRGEFTTNEVIRDRVIFNDLPRVIGSLNSVQIVNGSRDFNVGDIVHFNSNYGDYGLARVSEITNETGVVDFLIIDGGWGYTDSANALYTGSDLAKRTQSIVSSKVVVLANVITSNTVSSFQVVAGGSGYTNTDVITLSSPYSNTVARPTTNSTGGIVTIAINNPGSGFYVGSSNAVSIANSTGGATTGTGASVIAFMRPFPTYFKYFEDFVQKKVDVVYTGATNNQLFVSGSRVRIGNTTSNVAFGVVIENANGALGDANGLITIGISNNGSFGTGNTIYLESNNSIVATVSSITDQTATAVVMGIPDQANVTINALIGGTIDINDEVYQLDSQGIEIANAHVQANNITGTTGIIELINVNGVFTANSPLYVRNDTAQANVAGITLTAGLMDIVGGFTNTASPPIYSVTTGTTANLTFLSQGTGASFKVATTTENETVYLNTDLLSGNNTSNTPYLDLRINATAYGFPKFPSGNLSTVIFSTLTIDQFTLGTIGSLGSIDPGSDYNIDPYVLAYQPYITGFDYRDYEMEITNASGTFFPGERILQTNTLLTTYDLVLSTNTAGYEVGMKVYQGTANGFVSEITAAANTIVVRDVLGTFTVNATPVQSYSNVSISSTILSTDINAITSTAKGLIKSGNTTTLFVKRIQFEDRWEPGLEITGQLTGTTATIVNVGRDMTTLPIGLNADITANVVTANGTVKTLEIIDSGLGYRDNDEILYISEDGVRAGSAITDVRGVGVGSGYYRTSRGFLSSVSKLQDGDFYQEYSYEVLSRIPLDRYSDMFKKVMHTAGTKYFGSVLLESEALVEGSYADSSIEIS